MAYITKFITNKFWKMINELFCTTTKTPKSNSDLHIFGFNRLMVLIRTQVKFEKLECCGGNKLLLLSLLLLSTLL